jgi:hypothetical protein
MSRKRTRRIAVRRSRPKNTVRRPGDSQLVALIIDQVRAPAVTPTDLAKNLDIDWFRSHPNRSHRIRPGISGESPGIPPERYVVVRQVQPGVRLRQSFDVALPLPSEEAPEHIAHAIFDLFQEYRGRIVPDHELLRRTRADAVGADPEDISHHKPRYRH